LSCCHTVTIDENKNYSATSPDELALVSFAKKLEFEFSERDLKEN
jgi:magnesium-transporting ATPase (P-type)